jgi:hypothetical protein
MDKKVPPGSAPASEQAIRSMNNRVNKLHQEIIGRANPRACRELLPLTSRCFDVLSGYPSKDQLSEISRLLKWIKAESDAAPPQPFPGTVPTRSGR